MNSFGSLVRLFLRDLIRQRMVWLVVVAILVMFGLYQATQDTLEKALQEGESFDIASRRALGRLREVAEAIREGLPIGVALIALQLAPESRRNGTTQFVLTNLGVSRIRLALAQYAALGVFSTTVVLTVHVGYWFAGRDVGAVSGTELGLAWVTLVGPTLVLAAVVHALALTLSVVEVALLLFVVPILLTTFPMLLSSDSIDLTPLAVMLDNLVLLYPGAQAVIPWPRLAFEPNVQWQWPLVHRALAAAFWLVLGAWLLRGQNIGSRTASK